jgi:hypothetical protein
MEKNRFIRFMSLIMVLYFLFFSTGVFAIDSGGVGEAEVDFSMDAPKVGVPADLSVTVKDAVTGEAINDVKTTIDIVIVEDGLSVFSGDFYSPDGTFDMTYNFQDASEHAINLKVSPTESSNVQFQPVARTFLTEVELPDPPTKVWLKTWVFLMGLLVIGVGIGFFVVKFMARHAVA